MSHIFGCYEPFESIKITFFNGFIAQYFVSFFIDHTVFGSDLKTHLFVCTRECGSPGQMVMYKIEYVVAHVENVNDRARGCGSPGQMVMYKIEYLVAHVINENDLI